MKKAILMAVAMLVCCSSLAFAEATFDQIQTLIKAHEYAAAVQGLNLIIQNHPRSAKAYYAMSQAQAGVGNLAKAKEALDMATGIDPSLKFAPASNVEKLKEAVQPQARKIQAIESHTLRNCAILLVLIGIGAFLYYRRKGKKRPAEPEAVTQIAPRPRPSTPSAGLSTANYATGSLQHRVHPQRFMAPPPPVQPVQSAPAHHTTVINNQGSSSDFVAGMLVGEMINQPHHHTVEREVIREVVREDPRPSASRTESRTWEDDAPSRTSSSWDDSPASSSSSSYDSGSSSSSWDSSSDNSSSSSWD